RAVGEGASARLEDRRDAGAMVRAPAWHQPLPCAQVAPGLSALVSLRVCHDLSATAAGDGHPQGCAHMKRPRIRARSTTTVSPWVSIIAREVEFTRGAQTHIFHAVEQADYVSIVPLTPDGKIPIVRQYRPALESFSWELPAGMVDAGERPIDCC